MSDASGLSVPAEWDIPFQRKPRRADADKAIARADRIVKRLAAHDAARVSLVEQRARAVADALEAGATQKELAERFGVSSVRVRQWAKGE